MTIARYWPSMASAIASTCSGIATGRSGAHSLPAPFKRPVGRDFLVVHRRVEDGTPQPVRLSRPTGLLVLGPVGLMACHMPPTSVRIFPDVWQWQA
jgi:hypothetical protein